MSDGLTRDITLRVKAQNLTTAEFNQITASVNTLTGALDKQIEAAGRGTVKERELAQSLEQLGKASDGLKSLQTTIKLFQDIEKPIDNARNALGRAGTNLQEFRDKNTGVASGVGTLGKELERLENVEKRAQGTLDNLIAKRTQYQQTLEKNGFDTRNLTAAEDKMLAVADQIRAATERLISAKENYAKTLRENNEATRRQTEADIAAKKAIDDKAAAQKAYAAALQAAQDRLVGQNREQSAKEVGAGVAKYRAAQAEKARLDAEEKARIKERQDVQIRADAINQDLALQGIRARLKADADARAKANRDAKEAAVEQMVIQKRYRDGEREIEERWNRERAEVQRRADLGVLGRLREDRANRRRASQDEIADRAAASRTLQGQLRREEEEETRSSRRRVDGQKKQQEERKRLRLLGLEPYQLTNLGYQGADVLQGILGGTSGATIAAQQGPQIVQVFGLSVLKWTPIIVAGLAAIAVAVGAFQRTLREQSSNREFNAAINVNSLTRSAEALTALRKEARDMGISWTEAGAAIKTAMSSNIPESRMKVLLQAAQDAADAHGKKVPEAMKEFSTAIQGSADDILKLNDQYNFLDRNGMLYVRRKFEEGQADEAREFALKRLTDQLRRQAMDGLSPLTDATRKLSTAWDDLLVSISKTQVFKEASAGLLQVLADLKDLVKEVDAIAQNKPGARQGIWEYVLEQMFGADWRAAGRQMNWVRRQMGLSDVDTTPPWERNGSTGSIPATEPVYLADTKFANPRNVTFDSEALTALARVIAEASKTLPEGYTVQPLNAFRPGATVKGTGEPSEHGFKRAIDVKIVDASGKDVPGSMSNPTELYLRLDAAVQAQARRLLGNTPLAIGSTFGTPDAGHYSIAGSEAVANEQKRRRAGLVPEAPAATGPTRSASAADAGSSKLGQPNSEQIRIGQELTAVEKRRLEIATAKSVEEEKQKRYAEVKAQVEKETQDPIAQRDLIRMRNAQVDRDLEREADTLKAKRDKEKIDNARHYNEIVAAGDRAVAEALKNQNLGWRDIERIRDQAQSKEKDRLDRIDQQNNALQQVIKTVDDLKRANDGAFGTDVEKRLDAITVKYKNIAEGIKKSRDEATLIDKAKFDEQLARLPAEEDREKMRATGQALVAQAQAAQSTLNDLVNSYRKQREAGEISIQEEQDLTKKAFEEVAPAISAANDELQKWYETAKNAGVPALEIEKVRAKMQEVRTETKYVDPLWKGLVKTAEDSFGTRAVEAFDSISEAIGKAIAKTGEWKDVWTSMKSAAANFFAGILKDLATYVIKAELAKLMSSFIPALGGFPGAAAAGAAGSAGGAASSVGIPAAVAHSGALIGFTQTPTRTVPRAWFANAPRFHTGGLAADERTAILQNNEEVLTADNPRHVRNWGGGNASPDINIRNVLVADPELVPSHMASAAGERIIMNTLTRNVSTVRQLVR